LPIASEQEKQKKQSNDREGNQSCWSANLTSPEKVSRQSQNGPAPLTSGGPVSPEEEPNETRRIGSAEQMPTQQMRLKTGPKKEGGSLPTPLTSGAAVNRKSHANARRGQIARKNLMGKEPNAAKGQIQRATSISPEKTCLQTQPIQTVGTGGATESQ
jgi:hypothetical protein